MVGHVGVKRNLPSIGSGSSLSSLSDGQIKEKPVDKVGPQPDPKRLKTGPAQAPEPAGRGLSASALAVRPSTPIPANDAADPDPTPFSKPGQVTADMVMRILTEKQKLVREAAQTGKKRVKYIERISEGLRLDISANTLNGWLMPKNWTAEKNVSKLAKLTDYNNHRQTLQNLVNAMELFDGTLPQSSVSQRVGMTATMLHGLLSDERRIRNGEIAALRTALPDTTRKRWLTANGWNGDAPNIIAKTADYPLYRDALEPLLKELGFIAPETSLRAQEPGRNKSFSAAALTGALRTFLDWRGNTGLAPNEQTFERVAASQRLVEGRLDKWVTGQFRVSRKAFDIARLPDYEAYKSELSALLDRLGQTELARELPDVGMRRNDTRAARAGLQSSDRRDLDAAVVLAMLKRVEAGESRQQIAHDLHRTDGDVQRWLGQWETGNLAESLSKKDGYGELREEIGRLLSSLGLYQKTLPQPKVANQKISAEVLHGILGRLIDSLASASAERESDDPSSSVAYSYMDMSKEFGCNKNTIKGWISTKGIIKNIKGLANLDDYPNYKSDIELRLNVLGHYDLSRELPAAKYPKRNPMTVDVLIKALNLVQSERPKISKIAQHLSINLKKIGRYLSVDDNGIRLGDRDLSKLPDYAEQRHSLELALQSVGLDEEVDALPPAIGALEFLKTTSNDLEGMGRAIKAMRDSGKPSYEQAASGNGVRASVLAVAVEPDGAFRELGDLSLRLSDFQPHLKQDLARVLDWLQRSAAGETVQTPSARSDLMLHTIAGAGHAPDKVCVVPKNVVQGTEGDQVERLYANLPDLLRGPRPYTEDPQRQPLRWLSSVLKLEFREAGEPQCYYDEQARKIIVSAGRSIFARKIEKFLSSDMLLTRLDQARRSGTLTAREERHSNSLFAALTNDSSATVHPPGVEGDLDLERLHDLRTDIFNAMRNKSFQVEMRGVMGQTGGKIDVHAEQRLNAYSQEQYGRPLNRALLAGTMRRCGSCAEVIKAPKEEPRGPFWVSHAGRHSIDEDLVMQQNVEGSIQTYATLTREGKRTFDVDTESEGSSGE